MPFPKSGSVVSRAPTSALTFLKLRRILSGMRQRSHVALALLLAWGSIHSSPVASAQQAEPYRIGPEDVLSISFWQRPVLNQTVQVRQDGRIAVPIIGETEVAGLTAQEVTDRIVDRISRYDREISQALVQVLAYNARKVFVTGQVGTTGKYGYESVPDLWTVLRDAGGPLETADLSRVRVIQPSGDMEIFDLARILSEGRAETLPDLVSGTTVDVPRRADFLPLETYRLQMQDLQPVVYVTGAVMTPGPKPIEGDVYVYDALALAGGLSPDANVKKVQVISKAPGGPVAQTFDLTPDTKDRSALTYRMRYEDLVIVDRKGEGFFSGVRNIALVLGIVTSSIIIADRL